MKKKIELLSPAKDVEVGMAAINHGADAVYIGGPDFGAREKASNSIEDIERLCRHAALYDAKVYVTLNTLLYENELERARKMAYDCWNAGVDALIVQDMQLLQLDMPPIPLHASTQCDNLTVEKVQLLEQLGFSQVVLGRELSLKEIREIREKTTVPLEFFVHGALCVSHSGQCYLSQYIGNRSANRGACAQPCRLPWDLLDGKGKVLMKNRHLLCLKDLNNSAHLEELMDAGITSFKIEGRMKDADYVKNVTAYYRQKLDEIISRRTDFEQASHGHCSYTFEVNPEKSFNRGFTDFFINGRQKGIGSPFTPKSMGEYIGEVTWCNPLRMEIDTDKTLHNGDGLCFLNQNDELVGLRADVVRAGTDGACTVSTNRPHGAQRGAKIYRNLDLEWQKQVDASTGNRKIDINLTLAETETGYELTALFPSAKLSIINSQFSIDKIIANNPEKATENIRKKALQWGDTAFNPVNLELQFAEPPLIPASVIGEMKRQLVEKLTDALIVDHQTHRRLRQPSFSETVTPELPTLNSKLSTLNFQDPDTILDHLMTCHHCIRYANGMCSKETGQKATPLFIRNGSNTFRLEFDCRNCLMYVLSENN
ncbi:MAG: U32 family peptidase [Bacteroidales bacterium]|nr:U32 family peptidase [Bacteroidales bacterium]